MSTHEERQGVGEDDEFTTFETPAVQSSSAESNDDSGAIGAENGAENDAEDDDDFGSFDDGSFEEFEGPSPVKDINDTSTSSIDFENGDLSEINTKIGSLLDEIVPLDNETEDSNIHTKDHNKTVLDERSTQIYDQLSRIPHLKPNNWIKSQIRHNLLIKLGIPINLDEINEKTHSNHLKPPQHTGNGQSHSRRKSVNEDDINWGNFVVPEMANLNITDDLRNELMSKTDEILSVIETDNLNNSSKSFLDTADDAKLAEKLSQFKQNYEELIKLSSVWTHNFKDTKNNFEIYESVVQNLIGYSQKLERDQLLNNLNQVKSKSKKKKSIWR